MIACGSALASWPKIRTLRKARALCRALQESKAHDASAPLDNLSAAERHLAAVEQWLGGSGSASECLDRKSLVARLQLPHGLAGPDEIESFHRAVEPLEKEVLAMQVTSSVYSFGFPHPGQLYVSSSRLCFRSNALGVDVRFAIPWRDVVRLRVVGGEEDDVEAGPKSGHGYTVRVACGKTLIFDGQQVESITLCLFDHMAVVSLHRCTEVFTGARAFEETVRSVHPPSSAHVTSAERAEKHFRRQSTVYELQRRCSIVCDGWTAPFLPTDCEQWTSLVGPAYVRHPFLQEAAAETTGAEELGSSPPIREMEVLGRSRKCGWVVDVNADSTDGDGWQYGNLNFSGDPSNWSSSKSVLAHVRRRCWKPVFQNETDGTEEAAPTIVSLIEAENLKGKQLFHGEVGNVSLEDLAAALRSDDWENEGLLASWFQACGSKDVEVSPWASAEGAAASVPGKLRHATMRVPVPPAPMCPKETRITALYHIVVQPNEIVFECSMMFLDVPYGTYLNVMSCDVFTICGDTGTMLMTRSFAVQWLKSSWIASTIENNVANEVLGNATRFKDTVAEYFGL